MITPINTIHRLREAMTEVAGEEVDNKTIVWFWCMYNASSISDLSLKDIAAMLQEGVTAINSIEVVEYDLETQWEDVDLEDDEQVEEQNGYLTEYIDTFYGG